MNVAIITAIARHFLTAVGGAMAIQYDVDGDTLNAIIGGLSALVGVAWSIYDKKVNARSSAPT